MKKILVIEDDTGLAQELQRTLSQEGFNVTIVNNAEAGLKSVNEVKPDVIAIDLQISDLHVGDWVPRLRSQGAGKDIPIIALGNCYDRKSFNEALKAGISGCIYKSTLTTRALLGAIFKAMGPPVLPKVKAAGPTAQTPPSFQATATGNAPVTADLAFRGSLRETLLDEMPARMSELRSLLSVLNRSEEKERIRRIFDLRKKVCFLASNAALCEARNIANLASALEAFLKELHEKPRNINMSTLRTTASAIEFLAILAQDREAAAEDWAATANVLSVDDEPLSRRAVVQAINQANLKCVSIESPQVALTLLKENKFDLIILDVLMPEMDGFDLCKKARALPVHRETPVIFVTTLNDFESRTKSSQAGGSDFIAKPFVPMELAVKALIFTQKGLLRK